MILINGATIRSILSASVQQALVEKAFEITQDEDAHHNPLRMMMPLKGVHGTSENIMGLMPGWIGEGNCFGVKIVNIFHDNLSRSHPSHLGLMPLFDGETGQAIAIIDTATLTALRTAAVSAFATDLLARPDSQILGIIGTGEQAISHIEAIRKIRPIDKVIVCGSSHEKGVLFANEMSNFFNMECVASPDGRGIAKEADVICTVSSSRTPVLRSSWLRPGQHINAVGASNPSKMELGPNCVEVGKYFCDYLSSLKAEAGEYIAYDKLNGNADAQIAGEIGALVKGTIDGRVDDQEITIFRSLGSAVEDLVFAQYLYEVCTKTGQGQKVDF